MRVLALYKAEYKIGAACPLDKTILSFKKCFVLSGWNFNPASLKNNTEKTSAMEAHDVGCPLLLTCTELIESILSQLAISSLIE